MIIASGFPPLATPSNTAILAGVVVSIGLLLLIGFARTGILGFVGGGLSSGAIAWCVCATADGLPSYGDPTPIFVPLAAVLGAIAGLVNSLLMKLTARRTAQKVAPDPP